MKYKNILSKSLNEISYITINRPKQLNALNRETIIELSRAITIADNDNTIKCIIISGSGTKAFVAGADIIEFADYDKVEGENLARQGQQLLFNLLENASTPSIAAINGFALGGGLELAMACHIRVASENAMMGLPEVSLGVIPGYGGTQRLADLVGKGKAMEMITTAGMLSAYEAKDWRLVNYVCKQNELISTAEGLASKIKRNSPMAISKAIKSINAGFEDGLNGFDIEISEFGSCFGTMQFVEGTKAFISKRKANFN